MFLSISLAVFKMLKCYFNVENYVQHFEEPQIEQASNFFSSLIHHSNNNAWDLFWHMRPKVGD